MQTLLKTDWNLEWRQAIGDKRVPDTAEFWNRKATRCKKAGQLTLQNNDPYMRRFLDYAGIRLGESVLDIGCGPGTFAIPLAAKGHSVYAVDFSINMLAILIHEAHTLGGLDISPVLADWRDDWQQKSIEPADVAIASRSIAVADLGAAIKKINKWAKRRACISTAACGSPWFDRVVAKALGRHICQHSNFAYCMNILFSMDARPELRFIDSPKDESWATREAAVAAITKNAAPIKTAEESRLQRYFNEHLIEVTNNDGTRVWKRDYIRNVEWAIIAWDKL